MAENRYKRAEKVFPISLGAGDRAFEPRYSDQKPLGIHDLKGLLLFYIERFRNEIVSVFLLSCYNYNQVYQ